LLTESVNPRPVPLAFRIVCLTPKPNPLECHWVDKITKTLIPGLLDFKIVVQDGGKAVKPTHQSPLPPRKYISYLFLAEPRAVTRPEGFYITKNFNYTPGIEF
jgi:hypothetical protein